MPACLKTEVLGEEDVKGLESAFILVPNHSSHLGVPMVFSLLPDWITEKLATDATTDYFYRKRGISSLTSVFFNTYPILRKDKRGNAEHSKVAGMTGRLLRAGVPILVFPESTRSRSGKVGQPEADAATFVVQVGTPIVPITMLSGHEAIPVGRFLPKFRSEVCLFIGRPVNGREGESPEGCIARAFHAIELMLKQYMPHPIDKDGTFPFGESDDAA